MWCLIVCVRLGFVLVFGSGLCFVLVLYIILYYYTILIISYLILYSFSSSDLSSLPSPLPLPPPSPLSSSPPLPHLIPPLPFIFLSIYLLPFLFLFLSSPSSFPLSPIFLSRSPLAHPNIHSIRVGTYIYLFMFNQSSSKNI